MQKTVLTGIKPTGEIHLGNYSGAIKPALALAKEDAYSPVYFIADGHGLTKIHDATTFRHLSDGIAAAWLALGLDPHSSIFYRQSDLPEVFELTWILSCLCPKGLMNRAHAYKASTEENERNGVDKDTGVNTGLFTYPILMSADILLFQSELVPVGKDQIQHIEIARDLAENFNRLFGETFTLPEGIINESSSIIPGLDGRKMSKSYGNTIPLFSEPKVLKKRINQIKTDSSSPDSPKDPETSTLFSLYQEFASPSETAEMATAFKHSIGWGEVKHELFAVMNKALEEPRDKYHSLLSSPETMHAILMEGAEKARSLANPFLKEIKEKVGITQRM